MSADEALVRLADQARGSFLPSFRVSKAGMIDFDFSTPETMDNLHLIQKVHFKRKRLEEGGKTWEQEWIEVELYDAQAALTLLGRHHRLFIDRADVDVALTIEGIDVMLEKAYGPQ
jgi:hypothetical protein